jgi:hypothetical protein
MGDWRASSRRGRATALAVKAGSSSIKAGLYAQSAMDGPVSLLRIKTERIDTAPPFDQ